MTAYFQKRSRLRSCAILLLLSFLTLCITGCKNTSGTPEEHSFSTEDTNEKSYEYTIILPSDASAELINASNELSLELVKSFSLRSVTVTYYDNEEFQAFKNTRIILLGNTSHQASREALFGLKRDDTVCTVKRGYLIIGGKSHDATVAAISKFISDILPNTDTVNALFDGEEFVGFALSADYPIEDISINGYSLSSLYIVYPEGSSSHLRSLAYALRERLADLCGAYPDISAAPIDAELDRAIYLEVSDTYAEKTSKIYSSGSTTVICGASLNSLAFAALQFVDACEKTPALTVSEILLTEEFTDTLTVKLLFPDAIEDDGDIDTMLSITKELRVNLPPFVCFGFKDASNEEHYRKNLPEYTSCGNGIFILSELYEKHSASSNGGITVTELTLHGGFSCNIVSADLSKTNDGQALEDILSTATDNSSAIVLFLCQKDAELAIENYAYTDTATNGELALKLFLCSEQYKAEISSSGKITLLHPIFSKNILY